MEVFLIILIATALGYIFPIFWGRYLMIKCYKIRSEIKGSPHVLKPSEMIGFFLIPFGNWVFCIIVCGEIFQVKWKLKMEQKEKKGFSYWFWGYKAEDETSEKFPPNSY